VAKSHCAPAFVRLFDTTPNLVVAPKNEGLAEYWHCNDLWVQRSPVPTRQMTSAASHVFFRICGALSGCGSGYALNRLTNSDPIAIKFFKKEASDNPTPKGYSCGFDWQVASANIAPCARPFDTRATLVRCCRFDVEENSMIEVTRVQTGVRLESSLLKVLKALAAYTDLGLGDLLEGICLHAFEGKLPFSPETLEQIDRFRHIYGLSLTAADSHRLTEQPSGRAARSAPKKKHKTRR
jgi:hypothetical protein